MKIFNPFIKYFEVPDGYQFIDLSDILPVNNLVTPNLLINFAPLLKPHAITMSDILNSSTINTPLRISHFLAQCAHESAMFRFTTEGMNYSAEGLRLTFGKYFPTAALRNEYARQPQRIGNRAYANRNGNGPESSGDGYLYRGRGYLQLTGRANYTAYSRDVYGDLRIVQNPSLVAEPSDALKSSIWYWDKNNLNRWADADDVLAVSRAINLGNPKSSVTPNGIEDRKNQLTRIKRLIH